MKTSSKKLKKSLRNVVRAANAATEAAAQAADERRRAFNAANEKRHADKLETLKVQQRTTAHGRWHAETARLAAAGDELWKGHIAKLKAARGLVSDTDSLDRRIEKAERDRAKHGPALAARRELQLRLHDAIEDHDHAGIVTIESELKTCARPEAPEGERQPNPYGPYGRL